MLKPMLAEKAPAPFDSDRHLYEVKLDGMRALVEIDGDGYRLWGRSGADYTATFPELNGCLRVNADQAILDGELVALNNGVADFRGIQTRVHRKSPLAIKAAAQASPVTYMIFDVLSINGLDLTARGHALTLEQRKALLAQLVSPSERLGLVEHRVGDGVAFFQEAIREGHEGIMAKDRSGLYYPGRRHAAWQKLKGVQEGSYVVCGYTEGTGWREGIFGALLLGQPNGAGGLRYCGSVGTGFTEADLVEVQEMMRDIPRLCRGPFPERPYEPKLASFLEPVLVVDVKFHETTPDGKLRFPVFVAMRPDLEPE